VNPLISVVIPTYNCAKFLPGAISSVIEQTYKIIEIIVVDDCSHDDTEQVVKRFPMGIYNIKYIKHDENKGISATRNTGIATAKGEFIAFLDADDIWAPHKLEYQYKIFKENPQLGLVFTGYKLIDLNKRIMREYLPPRFKNQNDFIKNLLIRNVVNPTSSVLIKKECIEKVGLFDTSLKVAEDWDMWIRIAHKYKFGTVESPCVTYREHSQNISRDVRKMILYSTEVIFKNLSLFADIFPKKELQIIKKKALSSLYLSAAQGVRDDTNRRKEMLRYLTKSIFFYPLKTFVRDDKYTLLFKAIFPPTLYNALKKLRKIILRIVYKDEHPRLKPDHEDF